jgi:hypothetical protein
VSCRAVVGISLPEQDLEPAPVVERTAPKAGRVIWHLGWAILWGAAQTWLVGEIVSTVGWDRLPYNTVEDVIVWLFLATNATAWVILCYALARFRLPVLWLWWAACATWWIIFFLPYRETHDAFAVQLRASETAGLQLAARIEAYHRERGRLPGKLQDVVQRDHQPIPSTSVDTRFDYRLLDLKHFELAAPIGDKHYCYNSGLPREGFTLGYYHP